MDGTGALLAGASVGLAMFDKDLRLLACNETYRVLRGHTPEELVAGARLEDLIRRVLERLDLSDEQIAERLKAAMSHVVPGGEDTFRYVGPSAKLIEVHRACLPSGTLVETVRELDASASVTDLNVQFAQIAANARRRMSHALDAMAEGFALFDAAGKLVVFNRKYVQCRAVISDLIVRGATYETLLAEEINRGAFDLAGTSAEVFFCESVDRHRNPEAVIEVRLTDGRWHLINEMRTPDGGSVQTRSDITEMKEREADLVRLTRELHTRNAMFDAILDNLSQGLCLFGPDKRVIFANARYAEIYGLSREFVKPGTSLAEILAARAATGLYDCEDGRQLVKDGGATFGERVSQVMRLSDGRSVSLVRQPMPDGSLITTHEDVTERERLNERLAVQNMQLEAVMQNMVQGVAMYGADQRLVICNRRYIDMYNLSPDVVKPGVSLRDVMIHSASVGNYTEEEARRVLSERSEASNLTTRRTLKQHLRDGRVIAVVREPMPDGGSMSTCLDITEIERHAEQMREHARKLERSNRELQDFAYVASHDLQEPLRKIEAFGDRLATRFGSSLPEDGRMFLDRMQNAAGRMRRLINDLLDYSRVTTKAKPFTRVELGEVLTGVLSDLQIRIEESGAVITSDALPAIDADATQMRQLLQNVLANALKFRKADVKPEIRITCSVSEVGASFGARGARLRLEITDNGIGFDNKYKEQIFTIFQRLHGRLEYEGTGVGLATVRKIVERHGGTIDADGRPGIGATFIIDLPMRQQAGEVTLSAAS
ncbi:MAG: PAS-domain containing protein [Hyphomicrobiaceae bacterium]